MLFFVLSGVLFFADLTKKNALFFENLRQLFKRKIRFVAIKLETRFLGKQKNCFYTQYPWLHALEKIPKLS